MSDFDPTRHMAWHDEPEEGYGGLPSISGAEYDRLTACPWTSAVECAMASERGAAGTADYIRACPAHQPQLVDDLPVAAFLAAARLEGDYLDGPDLAECGCPIEYLEAEGGDHQPGCRLARG